jgi:hypothetical protein
MRFSSRIVGSSSVLSITLLLCGLNGAVMSETVRHSGGATSLPGVMVEAPRQVMRPQMPKQRAAARTTPSLRTVSTAQGPSASPTSTSAKLAKLANATGSCVGGCVTSFRSGDAPWHGCSASGWPALSTTCRNVANYKTYAECRDAGLLAGWRDGEIPWYCSSLTLK